MTAKFETPDETTSGTERADWSSSYSQFLARSAAQSARTLKLYQEALERVSQGALAPTVFQDHLPQFVQAHGTEYASKLSEVSARFLGELVRVGNDFKPGQTAAGTAADGEPEIVPPRFDAANPIRWYEQLAEYAGKVNARAVKTYRAQLDRVAAGESTPSEVERDTAGYLAKQVPQYLQQLAQSYFGLLNGLNETRALYEENYFRGVLAKMNGGKDAAAVFLRLTAPLGSTASASLSVTNTTGEKTIVSYLATEVRRADGVGRAFDPKVSVMPERLELNPGEERDVALALALDEKEYDAGAPYVGTLYLNGDSGLHVEVQLQITATPATVPTSGADPQRPQ